MSIDFAVTNIYISIQMLLKVVIYYITRIYLANYV